jgi:hypothetical protein
VLNALAFAALFALRPETRAEPGFAVTGRAGALHAEGANGPA